MLFNLKKERNPATATTWMDMEDITLSEITRHRKTQIRYYLIYMQNLK